MLNNGTSEGHATATSTHTHTAACSHSRSHSVHHIRDPLMGKHPLQSANAGVTRHFTVTWRTEANQKYIQTKTHTCTAATEDLTIRPERHGQPGLGKLLETHSTLVAQ